MVLPGVVRSGTVPNVKSASIEKELDLSTDQNISFILTGGYRKCAGDYPPVILEMPLLVELESGRGSAQESGSRPKGNANESLKNLEMACGEPW